SRFQQPVAMGTDVLLACEASITVVPTAMVTLVGSCAAAVPAPRAIAARADSASDRMSDCFMECLLYGSYGAGVEGRYCTAASAHWLKRRFTSHPAIMVR